MKDKIAVTGDDFFLLIEFSVGSLNTFKVLDSIYSSIQRKFTSVYHANWEIGVIIL